MNPKTFLSSLQSSNWIKRINLSSVLNSRWLSIMVITLMMCAMTGCMRIKMVRIPVPIPTFGLGSSKATVAEEASSPAVVPPPKGKVYQTGVASWYGREFHGRKTANGERYDMNAMTAAHPKLPFDTLVRVTDMDSGKSIVVRINDRGPFKKGRVIDLSRKAATELGMIRKGLARVRLEKT